jgi:hypothetical protein
MTLFSATPTYWPICQGLQDFAANEQPQMINMIKPEERIKFYEEKLVELNSLYMRLEADQILNFASFDSYKNLKECIYRLLIIIKQR